MLCLLVVRLILMQINAYCFIFPATEAAERQTEGVPEKDKCTFRKGQRGGKKTAEGWQKGVNILIFLNNSTD